ncbi:hypothetical protein SAMN04488058_104200 [Deinococcus reticulitermitis]|uniref:Uncharacterized protein n=1 Tax=Deinococcus reticulitermitis TaxID=856736 RepID=A0A1H6WPJ4_9DEIO|nr:hypothetical protein [Deinococcus reticulitermitis]SEJ17114.1 hypothetical protein SAMN04488058_104200 [Deinococcus reticulitermitis]
MRAIGPYVVRREVPPHRAGAGPSGEDAAGRRFFAPYLWATDRLTGMPALLHPVDVTVPLPHLPAHPLLLPFTDLVAEVAHSYLVTELPLPAEAETDPERAARGALEVLAFLHKQGLTHGALDSGQFWRVGGGFGLSGAGLPRPGLHPTPADDLHDLGAALSELGPLPPALSVLRGDPGRLSARELLRRLDAAEGAAAPPEPAEPDPPFEVWDAGELAEPDTAELLVEDAPPAPPAAPPTLRPPVPFDLILSPEAAEAKAPAEPEPASPAAWSQEERDIAEVRRRPPTEARGPTPEKAEKTQARTEPGDRAGTSADPVPPAPPLAPTPVRSRAASRASERLKADSRRILDHTAGRRDQVAAQVAAEAEEGQGDEAAPGQQSGPPDAPQGQAETPQQRRRREWQARREEEALREQLAALRQAAPAGPQESGDADPGQGAPGEMDIAEIRRRGPGAAPAGTPKPSAPPPTPRQLGPIRIGWDRKGERQVIRPVSPRQQLLRWLLPVLGVLVLVFALSLLVRVWRPAPPLPTAECCALRLQLAGVGAGERAALTLVRAPQGVALTPGRVLGELPGEVRFPAPGVYRVQVSTLPPAAPRSRTLDLRLPNPELLTVSLGE